MIGVPEAVIQSDCATQLLLVVVVTQTELLYNGKKIRVDFFREMPTFVYKMTTADEKTAETRFLTFHNNNTGITLQIMMR